MAEKLTCDYCHETLEENPIRRGEQVYCCQACAFEAGRSKDCGGREDPHAKPIVEQV